MSEYRVHSFQKCSCRREHAGPYLEQNDLGGGGADADRVAIGRACMASGRGMCSHWHFGV